MTVRWSNELTNRRGDQRPNSRGRDQERWSKRFVLAFATLMLAFSASAGGPELNLNRSFYVPVRFVACPHVENVTLSVAGEDVAFPLGERKFLFTYYADHQKVLPEYVEVTIKGHALCNGKQFETSVMVTLDGTHSSNTSVATDMEWFKKQLRIHRDVRFPARRIFITCSSSCESDAKVASQPESEDEDKATETAAESESHESAASDVRPSPGSESQQSR